MIKIGSGTGQDGTDADDADAVSTDRRECRNSYVDWDLTKSKGIKEYDKHLKSRTLTWRLEKF